VNFFDKEAAKNRPDMLGYYDPLDDTIYLNHWAIFDEVKKKNIKISEATLINRIMAVLNHETFHAAVHPHLEDHLRQFLRENLIENKEVGVPDDMKRSLEKTMQKMLINTIGHIWQEIGVRIHQEGQHPDQAIINVLHEGSGYRGKISAAMKEYQFFAEDKKKKGDRFWVLIVEFVDEFITDNIKLMLEKLNTRLRTVLDSISGERK